MSAVGGLISYLTNAMRTPEDTTSRHQRQDEAQNEPAETHNAPPTSQARPTTDTVDTNQVKSANSRVTSHKAESTPRHVGNASAPSSSTATKARASPNQTEIQAPKSQQNVEYVALSEENDRLKQTNANQKDEITRLRKEYAHASRSSAWQVGNLGHRLDDSKRDLKTAAEQNRPSQERIKQLEEQLKKGLEQRDQWSHKAEEHQKKSDDLQSQVNDLGRRVAAQNRSDTHIADNELHDRMRQLFFDVQNWALNGFRKSGPGESPQQLLEDESRMS